MLPESTECLEESLIWNISCFFPVFFLSVCYYYYNYCFITPWRWFFTYIYLKFESTIFGFSSVEFIPELNPFIPHINFYILFFLSLIFFNSLLLFFNFSLSFVWFFMIVVIIISSIIYVYVFSMCTNLAEKRLRYPQGLSLALYVDFRIFKFLFYWIVRLANLKYSKKDRLNTTEILISTFLTDS